MGAREFVETVALPPPPEGDDPQHYSPPPAVGAVVVGNAILAMSPALDGDERAGVMNAMLLAQLAAKRRVSDSNDAADWYTAYFDTLQHIGFTTLNTDFFDHAIEGSQVEVHEIALEIAAALLGEASQAYVLVKRVVELLATRASDSGTRWHTIFEREARAERQCQFQVVSVEKEAAALVVSLMAYSFDMTSSSTKVLFVKVGSETARLAVNKGRLAIDWNAYNSDLRKALAARVSSHVADHIARIPI